MNNLINIKSEINLNIKSLPSSIMVIVDILNFIKNNNYFIKLLNIYKNIYFFDEANITYNSDIKINNYIDNIIRKKKNIL